MTRIAIVMTAVTGLLGLNRLGAAAAASASAQPVTCTKASGLGTKRHPAVFSGCTNTAKTGGKGTVLVTSPDDTHIVWKITWATKHGTSAVRLTFRKAKVNKCPKGFNIEAIDTGHITASSGAVSTAIPVGQKTSDTGCASTKTDQIELLPGTRLVL